jgi:formamidopyrimidine-DNA glycosylase
MLELPEVLTLSRQLDEALRDKTVASASRGNSPHKFAFFKPPEEQMAKLLIGRRVRSARGNGKCMFLELAPRAEFCIAEMDGKILFHQSGAVLPAKYQLLLSFTDGTTLTATVGLWGFFGAGSPEAPVLVNQEGTLDPLSSEFTFSRLNQLFEEYPKPNHAIKAFLINRPRIRGFGNGYMQEMLFRAGILPTRKVNSLDAQERQRLYRAIRGVLTEATKKGGSRDSPDIYGRPGKYIKVLGAKVRSCIVCHGSIEKKSFLGGTTYFCPQCQK